MTEALLRLCSRNCTSRASETLRDPWGRWFEWGNTVPERSPHSAGPRWAKPPCEVSADRACPQKQLSWRGQKRVLSFGLFLNSVTKCQMLVVLGYLAFPGATSIGSNLCTTTALRQPLVPFRLLGSCMKNK